MMESKETSVCDSDFTSLLELEKKIEYLEDELTQANGRLVSLEELLTLAENVLCRCACPYLKEQISLLLSNLHRFVPKCGRSDSPTISKLRFVDVATQCDDACDLLTSELGHEQKSFTSDNCILLAEADETVEERLASAEQANVTDTIVTLAASCAVSEELSTAADISESNLLSSTSWADGSSAESIAGCVKTAAEAAVQESQFIYDAETGLYYDCVSGQYYDAEKSMYYEPQSGRYFSYDPVTESYQYHGSVGAVKFAQLSHIIYNRSRTADSQTSHKLHKRRRLKCVESNTDAGLMAKDETAGCEASKHEPDAAAVTMETASSADMETQSDGDETDEVEEGELVSSSSSESELELETNVHEKEIQFCTPCIRAMVIESSCIAKSSLFIITCSGGTIGREVELHHAIVIPDPTVSKMHCSIEYSAERQRYVVKDHASQAGTFVNGKRLSKAKVVSEAHVLYHGDVLKVANHSLSLHIHPRQETCSDCEPGCCIVPQTNTADASTTPEDRERARRQQLRRLKMKFGLTAMNYEDHPSTRTKTGVYQDRAAERRRTIGSETPRDDTASESASVHRAIPEENVGHKLLAKMGWKEGDSLGKSNAGILEPVNVNFRVKPTAGLGAYPASQLSLDDVTKSASSERWVKAQDRYAQLTATGPASSAAADSSDPADLQCNVNSTKTGPVKWVKGH